jgi:hypothetical protein
MSDTSQIALIRNLYAAMGNVNSFKSLLAEITLKIPTAFQKRPRGRFPNSLIL